MADPYATALGLKAPAGPPPSAFTLSPEDQASSDAMERGPTGRDGFDLEYVKATPAQRLEMERSLRLAAAPQAPKAANDPYAAALGIGEDARPLAGPRTTALMNGGKPEGSSILPRVPAQYRAFTGVAAQGVTGLGASIIGGYRGLSSLINSAASGDDLSTSLRDASDAVERELSTRTISPNAGTDADVVGRSKLNPMNWPGMAGGVIGNKVGEVTGSPVLATAADVGTQFALPIGAAKLAKIPLRNVGKPAAPVAPRVEPSLMEAPAAQASDLSLAPQEAVPVKSPPVESPVAADLTLAPQEAVPVKSPLTEPPVAAGQGRPNPGIAGRSATSPVVSAGKAVEKPAFSAPEQGVFAEEAPDRPGGISSDDQQRRATVLRQVGLDQVRKSAVTGDAGQAAVDFQTSRLKGSPSGELMSQTLDTEKRALTDYSERIAQETGGSSLNDQAAKYARGGTIMKPLESLSDWFDAKTKALYDTAAERAQGVPTQLDRFRTVLGDDSLATNTDTVQMRQAAQSYAKQLNIIREDGTIFSDGQQAETLRKYLNENWSPQNARLVNKLKAALDEDVMASAGEDVYGEARKLWALKKDTIDNPNGIAKLLDSSGPNEVNRKVPIEKVADTLTNMPVDQLDHIVKTLRNAPDEIQPQAQAALNELKVQFAHNVHDIGAKHAGQWNAKGVRQYLDNNSKRMSIVFTPEELQKFGTLNDAGNILAKDQSYPGAFAQHQNLVRAGVAHGIQGGAAAIGGAVAGAPGAYVGSALGGNLASKFNDAATLRATQKRMVKLSDVGKKTKP